MIEEISTDEMFGKNGENIRLFECGCITIDCPECGDDKFNIMCKKLSIIQELNLARTGKHRVKCKKCRFHVDLPKETIKELQDWRKKNFDMDRRKS